MVLVSSFGLVSNARMASGSGLTGLFSQRSGLSTLINSSSERSTITIPLILKGLGSLRTSSSTTTRDF